MDKVPRTLSMEKLTGYHMDGDIGEKTVFRNQSIYDEEGLVSVLWLYY